jgi:hypothetical protein
VHDPGSILVVGTPKLNSLVQIPQKSITTRKLEHISAEILQGNYTGKQQIPRKDGMVSHDLLSLTAVDHPTHGNEGHHLIFLKFSTEEFE